MATVVDELVLQLGLDTTKFSQGQRDAMDSLRRMQFQLEEGGKQAESSGKKLEEYFGGLKRGALQVGAAFFGGRGVKEFTEYITNLDGSVGRLSRTLNVSERDVSAWQGVARQTGGTAESVAGSMQGITDQINRFGLTGQSTLLPLLNNLNLSFYDQNKNLKTASDLFLDINHAVQGMDPGRARSLMQMMGIDNSTINLLLSSEDALRKLLGQMRQIGTTTKESSAAAQELSGAWARLQLRAEDLGRDIYTKMTPAMRAFVGIGSYLVDKARHMLTGAPMLKAPEESVIASSTPTPAGSNPSPNALPPEREAFIRKTAASLGIDPDQAVRVAKSEGLGGKYAGDDHSSFGDFQLHMGGLSNRPGMGGPGLGDEFKRRTGLDPRDPATWQAQDRFALEEARKSGWGAWHGWKGDPRAGIGTLPGAAATSADQAIPGAAATSARSGDRGAANTTTSTVTIGTVVVNTQAKDAEGIARDIRPALERNSFAGSANYGQVP